jgi:hypothetical protein
MNKNLFYLTAWKGGAFGLRVSLRDRSRIIDREVRSIEIQIPCQENPAIVNITDSFWRNCSEFRSFEFKKYFQKLGIAEWERRNPPRICLEKLGRTQFRIVE